MDEAEIQRKRRDNEEQATKIVHAFLVYLILTLVISKMLFLLFRVF